MKLANRLVAWVDRFSNVVGWLVSFFLVGIIVVMLFEMTMRRVLALPQMWTQEMSQFLFGIYAALIGGYTCLYNGHIRMDVLYSKLSQRGRIIMDLATAVFFILFLGVLIWKGSELTALSMIRMERSDSAWGPLLWPTRLMVPLGAFLLLLQVCSNLVKNITLARGKGKANGT
jgi:TRAP-type mannitol/chloroaromatic compound transport system permease small subunit